MKSGAVILAAGLSSRMGSFKPLLELGGKTMLERAVTTMRRGGVDKIVVVTGHRGGELRRAAAGLDVRCIDNPDYHEGMFSSVRTGVQKMTAVDAFFVLPVDIPLVRTATVAMLLSHCRKKTILYPEFDGEKGHPPLIPGLLRKEIVNADGGGGLAAVLVRHPSRSLAVWDRHILVDADTPEAFAALARDADRHGILSGREAEILAESTMPHHLVVHSQLVAKIALCLEKGLRQGGAEPLDRELIYGAALLHDICKGRKNHAAEGKKMLAALGLAPMAEIVGAHTEIRPPKHSLLREKEIVCLADKLVQGEKRVRLKERFAEKLHDYRDDKEACRCIRQRRRQAEKLAELWEKSAGREIEAWLNSEE